jgi:hypothetical protein
MGLTITDKVKNDGSNPKFTSRFIKKISFNFLMETINHIKKVQ